MIAMRYGSLTGVAAWLVAAFLAVGAVSALEARVMAKHHRPSPE